MKKPEQIYAPENVEDLVEQALTEDFGPCQRSAGPGLKWLLGEEAMYRAGYLDHAEYRRKDGKRTMIGRPYDLSLEDLQSLVELAREKGVSVSVRCPSNYNYRTVLVIITEWNGAELYEKRHSR